ncbi:MAG: hypothetical protein IKE04_02830, partial [Oscillospiraceae bacterium]|nr:hypothetical protein [Oscillospiraceae bacterium]
LDGLTQVFTVDIPALLNGETSILDLVFGILNGTTVEEASSRLSGFGSAVTGGMIAAIGTYLTLDVLAPITDSLLGENAFAAFGVLFGSKILGSIAESFTNLTCDVDEAGKFNNPIVQSISDLLQSVFSIDLAKVMKDMDILTDEGEVTEKAKGMAEKVASWGSVIGRVISSSLNSNTNWFTLAIDGSTLVSAISNALQSQETELTSDETSEIVSAASGVLSSVTGLLGMPLLQALFAIGSDTTTRRDFLSLFLGEFLGKSDDSAVKNAAYDILGDKFAGGGLWDTLMDILLGAPEGGYKHYDAATGDEIADDMLEGFQGTIVTKMASERPERGGVWGSLLNWLLGHDETGEDGVTQHVNGVFETLWAGIRDGAVGLADDLVTILSGAFDRLWPDILAKMPQWLKTLLGIEGASATTANSDGSFTIKTSSGGIHEFSNAEVDGINAQDVLNAYGVTGYTTPTGFITDDGDLIAVPGLKEFGDDEAAVDPSGVYDHRQNKLKFGGMIEEALNSGNYRYAQYLLEGFGGFNSRYNAEKPWRKGLVVSDWTKWINKVSPESVPDDWTPKTQVTHAPADIPVDGEVKFDKTQMQNAADSVGPVSIEADADFSSSGGSGGVGSGANGSTNTTNEYHAWGGRIASDTVTHVGEDGPEYIIPISKPRRAMDLIMRMFHEMGGNVLRQVVEGFGLNGGADTIGGSLSTLGIPQSSISITNNVNVTNTIYVQGGDRSASEIGYAAYDASERYLLRTLQGVLS